MHIIHTLIFHLQGFINLSSVATDLKFTGMIEEWYSFIISARVAI